MEDKEVRKYVSPKQGILCSLNQWEDDNAYLRRKRRSEGPMPGNRP